MQQIPLAVIAALDDEIKTVVARMSVDARVHVRPALFMRGMYDHRPLLLCRSGLGLAAMEHAINYMLCNYRPGFCLHVGYCGGADPALAPGDIVIASSVVDACTEHRLDADPANVERAQRICADMKLRCRTGGIATVEELVASPHEKAFVGTKLAAAAIDMESTALAAACAAVGVPYLVVRAVLDPLDHAIPDFSDSLDEAGRPDGLALAEHLLKHPYDALKLPHLEYFASQARHSITAFVDAWIKEG
ncbi:MAG: hypothetical protein WC956_07105 [bacterium]